MQNTTRSPNARLARGEGLVFRNSNDPVPHATVHGMLRNRIYTGDFDWDGVTYRRQHEPLVSRELRNHVQEVLDHRFAKRLRQLKRNFAFSGLIACGHCGCSVVGEIKKGRYVYYHCTGSKGKCPEPYVREEVLAKRFAALLDRLVFDNEVMAWVTEALRESHEDEKRYHDEAVVRLQGEYTRLQHRIDAMCMDKLDGRIDAAFFDGRASEWRTEQDRLLRAIEEDQAVNQNYLDDGIRLLELASRAPALFQKQEPREKRRLLNFLLSNCTWKDGELKATFQQPFDKLAVAAVA